MKNCIFAALMCAIASAHVRMRYTGTKIRNANTANADGKFSTAGPCGGNKKWSDNGKTDVVEGAEIELSIAYNGGHKSDTKNFFSVAYVCGKPDTFPKVFEGSAVKGDAKVTTAFTAAKGVLLKPPAILAPAAYPVDATASLTAGYKIKFTVPKPPEGDGEDARKCTISLVEYRNWGGCVDLVVAARDPSAPTPPPPPPPSLSKPDAVSLAQMYDITDVDFAVKKVEDKKCGLGDCSCATAVADNKCLWTKGRAKDGACLVCQYKADKGTYKDNCLCDVRGKVSYIQHYGTCARDSPNCLCMEGMIKVWHKTSEKAGTVDVNLRVTNPDEPDQAWALFKRVPLAEEGRALATATPVTVEVKGGGESYTQQVMIKSTPAAPTSEDKKRVYFSIAVVDDNPKICSLEATLLQDPAEVKRQDAATEIAPEPTGKKVARARAISSAATAAVGYVALMLTGLLQ